MTEVWALLESDVRGGRRITALSGPARISYDDVTIVGPDTRGSCQWCGFSGRQAPLTKRNNAILFSHSRAREGAVVYRSDS
jgi:hypothetical protein